MINPLIIAGLFSMTVYHFSKCSSKKLKENKPAVSASKMRLFAFFLSFFLNIFGFWRAHGNGEWQFVKAVFSIKTTAPDVSANAPK